jgi:hypothetical protein
MSLLREATMSRESDEKAYAVFKVIQEALQEIAGCLKTLDDRITAIEKKQDTTHPHLMNLLQ